LLQITSGNTYDRQGSINSASGENSPIPINFNRSLCSLVTCMFTLLSNDKTWRNWYD